eukprot:CAMPEP_0184746054 /NCGR_PEP_ID=MMETSP0315-20130426/8626_1 /TAXON_ID=101924 /ORGANISM="Rhodosorus marinus, Strain UTEX LB 2760" /LENGTH=330 /DNA_ID=CAMNT_0027218437 /DNA_START=138 /DNA_END=1130 /DNA_ORIENTATION=+
MNVLGNPRGRSLFDRGYDVVVKRFPHKLRKKYKNPKIFRKTVLQPPEPVDLEKIAGEIREQPPIDEVPTEDVFSEVYRRSGSAYPIRQGDRIAGAVVGYQKPRWQTSNPNAAEKVSLVDFGFKQDVQFNPKEIPEAPNIHDTVTMPIFDMENEFDEPSMDYSRSYDINKLKADRMQLLRPPADEHMECPPILYGRYTERTSQTYLAKVLGKEGSVSFQHAVRIGGELVGSYGFFALSRIEAKTVTIRGKKDVRHNPVLSAYIAQVLILCNLVIHDPKSPPEVRLAYLKLLTRIVFDRNSLLRQYHAKTQRGRGRGPRWEKFEGWFSSGAQ